MQEAGGQFKKAQDRYRRTFNKRLRNQTEEIRTGDLVFLRIEKRDDNQTRHKLAALAEGPFEVINVDS